jgi:hypothetical protein
MPSPHTPCHTSTHTSWLRLWEMGWSLERIASTWAQPLAYVEEVLNELSMQPIPQRRQVPRLPATPAEAQERRDLIRLLHRQGASVDELGRRFFYYSPEVIEKIVKQPLETARGEAWGTRGVCRCGCGASVKAGQRWATSGCKKRTQRRPQGVSP